MTIDDLLQESAAVDDMSRLRYLKLRKEYMETGSVDQTVQEMHADAVKAIQDRIDALQRQYGNAE